LYWLPLALAAYAFVGGLTSFFGWAVGLRMLTDWPGNGISVQPNATIAAMCASAGLVLAQLGWGWSARLLGFLTAAIGVSALFEYLSGIDLGIDTLLMFDRTWGEGGTLSRGRMGPSGAFCWTLIGSGLVLLTLGPRSRLVAPLVALTTLGIAGFSLVGYLYGASPLYSISSLTTIALQTATFIAALSMGLIAAIPERQPMRALVDRGAQGILVRRLLPFVLLMPIILGAVRLAGQHRGWYGLEFGTAALVLSVVTLLVIMLWRVATRVEANQILDARAQKLVRESEERYRSLVSVITDIPWTTNAAGEFATFQQPWLEYTGFSWEQHRGMGWLNALHPDDRERIARVWQTALEKRSVYESSARLWHAASHEYRHIVVRGVPLINVDRSVREWVGSCTDVHNQQLAEHRLKEADRQKDQFLATLAHELRNPLAPLRNGLQIMRLSGGGGATEQVRSIMERQVSQMVRLIDELLDVTRIAQGTVSLQKSRVTLAAVLRSALETSRPVIEGAHHELTIDIPPEPIYVDADELRLAQVFVNLLNNSAKYTRPHGRIRVMVHKQAETVSVSIIDNGTGIPRDMLAKVFDLFVQVDNSLERTTGGLGVGLTIAKKLIELHGGSIEAQSEGPGMGSSFVVRLPIVLQLVNAQSASEERSADLQSDRRVLVADDNEDSAQSLAMMLKMMGSDTKTAHDGVEALEVGAAFEPHLVLLDIGMPRMNGYDTARRMRQERWGGSAMLVAMTGWGRDIDKRRSQEAGFDEHLVKPIEMEALEMILKKTQAQGQGARTA
jgi:PAS domain S-box-containing protein